MQWKYKKALQRREKVIKLFDYCSEMASKAKYRGKHGKGIKILTPKQIPKRLPIVPAQLKANEIRELIHSLYWANKITKNYMTI